jgi:hypothetical protein
MEEMTDVIVASLALTCIRVEIQNRQHKRQQLWEQIIALDGQIIGLHEAEHQIEKLPGHSVALPK